MTLTIAMPALPPGVPALQRLLARARRLPDAPDWRTGIAAQAAPFVVAGLPPEHAGTAMCLVSPLHVEVGMSRVHLPPHGLLELAPDELDAWRAAFNAEWGGSGGQLLPAVHGGWVLAAPFASAASDPAPQAVLGQPLSREPAAGEAARALRRLGTEVEMWLAEHPLNRPRPLPVNCFWFWGVCTVASSWSGVGRGASQTVVLDPAAPTLDADWFEPVEQALRSGDLRTLRLQLGDGVWQLQGRSWLNWLRRA